GRTVTFDGLVGGGVTLQSLSVGDAVHAITTAINTATVATSGDQTYNNATTLSAPATLNAGTGTISFGDTLDTAATDLTLTADELDCNGGANSVSGTGTRTLQPSAANVSIGIGGGAGTLDISDVDIAALANGFTLITIGRSDGNGTMTVDSAFFKDAVTLREP